MPHTLLALSAARNPQYIDKNYGGVFIFWDFLFNSFKAEDPKDPPVYGLVHPVKSYNPFYLQFHCWLAMFKRIYQTPGLRNKLLVPLMGPGWDIGKPRLGYNHEIPEVSASRVRTVAVADGPVCQIQHPVTVWDPPMNLLEKAYTLVHFPLVVLFYHELSLRNGVLSQQLVTCGILVLLASLTSLGFLIEKRWFAPMIEFGRCIAFFAAEQALWPVVESIGTLGLQRQFVIHAIRLLFLVSAIGCALLSLSRVAGRVAQHLGRKPVEKDQ